MRKGFFDRMDRWLSIYWRWSRWITTVGSCMVHSKARDPWTLKYRVVVKSRKTSTIRGSEQWSSNLLEHLWSEWFVTLERVHPDARNSERGSGPLIEEREWGLSPRYLFFNLMRGLHTSGYRYYRTPYYRILSTQIFGKPDGSVAQEPRWGNVPEKGSDLPS